MPVDELPPGEWTELLIGDQWPSTSSTEAILNGARARKNTASHLEHYADHLLAINSQNLSAQEGLTADGTRAEFKRGERLARDIALSNRVKSDSYSAVHQHVLELRRALRDLAFDGNARIEEVNASTRPLTEKVAEIVDIATEVRGRALSKASSCASEIYSEMHLVLTAQGIDLSPWIFAEDSGVGWTSTASPNPSQLEGEITRKIDQLSVRERNSLPSNAESQATTSIPTNTVSSSAPSAAQPLGDLPANTRTPETSSRLAAKASTAATTSDLPTNGLALPEPDLPINATTPTTDGPAGASTPFNSKSNTPPATGRPVVDSVDTKLANAAPAPTGVSDSSSVAWRGESTSDVQVPLAKASPSQHAPLNPSNDLAQSFNAGNHSGTPVSASAEAISTVATSPVHTNPPPLGTPLADTTAAAHPVFETAHAAAPIADDTQIASPPTEVAQPVVATPVAAPVAPLPTTPIGPGQLAMPSPTPSSGLLGYGADLRPPTASAPAPLPMPASTAPVSAPLNPATGTAHPSQPAVMRQQPLQAGNHTATGFAERAVAATATGAATGATVNSAAGEARLRRLLDAVARQRPELSWAIAEFKDGSTVVVTDVAGGWVPPDIEIPTGVTLLQPADRRGDLATMLGHTIRTAAYRPGQHLANPDDLAPVSMSIRARDTAVVEDLGWELAQATKWRDGLPRLAHTLAKAVSAQTGFLDSEVALLRDYLTVVAHTVLTRYPGAIDPQQVGNWQLLTTIDALLNNEKTLANYHFAWFQAHALTWEARR